MKEVHFDINLDDIFLIDYVFCTLTYCALNISSYKGRKR